jgi:hypothetical protein
VRREGKTLKPGFDLSYIVFYSSGGDLYSKAGFADRNREEMVGVLCKPCRIASPAMAGIDRSSSLDLLYRDCAASLDLLYRDCAVQTAYCNSMPSASNLLMAADGFELETLNTLTYEDETRRK